MPTAKNQRIERERILEREQVLLQMFNAAAADLTAEDLQERESLLGGFAGGQANREVAER